MASKITYVAVAVLVIIIVGSIGIWWFYSQGVEHRLVIIHPHSAALADSVINDFKDWVQEAKGYSIEVSQLTPGGSGAVLEQVFAWEGIPAADIYWGGGSYNFEEAANLHSWAPTPTESSLLEPYKTVNDADIVETFNGWAMKEYNEDEDTENPVFYAAALSGFGFMWNTEYLSANGLATPSTYEDLLDPQYQGQNRPEAAGHTAACQAEAGGNDQSLQEIPRLPPSRGRTLLQGPGQGPGPISGPEGLGRPRIRHSRRDGDRAEAGIPAESSPRGSTAERGVREGEPQR